MLFDLTSLDDQSIVSVFCLICLKAMHFPVHLSCIFAGTSLVMTQIVQSEVKIIVIVDEARIEVKFRVFISRINLIGVCI